jgi:glycine/serine hydroxymethyltransferase
MSHAVLSLCTSPCAGTPALTSRGFKEADFEQVGDFMDEAIELGIEINKTAGV